MPRVIPSSRLAQTCLVLAAAVTCMWAYTSKAAPLSEARLFAGEVNLRASDLPGFKTVLSLGETRSGPLDSRVEACDGGPILEGAVHGFVSALFERQKVPVQTVLSAVYRVHDPSTARRYIRAASGRRGLRCIVHDELAKSAGLPRLKIALYSLRSSIGGAAISGVRRVRCIDFLRTCERRTPQGFQDRLWFVAGRYVVMLGFVAGPSNPATAHHSLLPIERRLLALLHDRAQAHKP